jgi:putative DNA primase/helicase
MSPLDKVLAALQGVRKAGAGWEAKCPAHDDRHASLCINEGRDSRVLLKCQAGCKYTAVMTAAGLQVTDLFARASDLPRRQIGRVVETYTYLDADGTPLFEVHRFEPKDFLQKLPGAAKYGGLNGTKRVPYRLLELTHAEPDRAVFVVEGERDVNRLMELGLVATCNPGGAGKWRDEYSDYLGDRTVYILPDNDEPGAQHAEQVARSLQGKAREIRIVPLPGLPPKGDVSDWLNAGHSDEELKAIVRAAGVWPPNVHQLESEPLASGASSGIRVRTAAQFAAETPAKIEWIAEPWIVAGAITELDGKVKRGGKTTFLLDAVYHVTQGRDWLSKPTLRTPIVYLTEQPESSFREALHRGRLLDCRDLHLMFWADTRGVGWSAVVDQALQCCKRVGSRLLVIDTLGKFTGLSADSENQAGAAQEAMAPLQMLTSRGIGVVVSRHDRKGPGEVGESARGSSQFTGDADIVLQIHRGEGNTRPTVRILDCLSRFEIPESLVVEWTPDGFIFLGTEADLGAAQAREAILSVVGPDGALTEKEILDAIPEGLARTTVQRELAKLVTEDLLARSGRGKRGDPYRYVRPEIVSAHIDNKLGRVETPPDPDVGRGVNNEKVSAQLEVLVGTNESARVSE